MSGMFQSSVFNKPLNSWNVSSVTQMDLLFNNSSFNQDISNWDVSNVTIMNGIFTGDTAFSTAFYDLLLIGWSALTLKPNVELASETKFSLGAATTARGVLTSAPNNWTVIDGGQV